MAMGITLGIFHHDLTSFSRALGIISFYRDIIPFYGRKIQVSELLQITQNSLDTFPFTDMNTFCFKYICYTW